METKILIIDDSKIARSVAARAFKNYDCQILEAGDGLQGFATAMRERPNLILLDFHMPTMDGGEMLAKLRSSPLKDVPVIMLTGGADRADVLRLADLGLRDCLLKPFSEEALLERVSRVLDLQAKGTSKTREKRFDDPLSIMVIDDKVAIVEQVRNALRSTPWKVEGFPQPAQALAAAERQAPDAILISLSLPNDAALTTFKLIQGLFSGRTVPVLGLSLKTAVADHNKATQLGFNGIITKPIQPDDVKSRIVRALNLDISYRYFEQRDDVLVLTVPATFTQEAANEISGALSEKVTALVDAGYGKFVIDLSQVQAPDVALIKLVISALQVSKDLSVRNSIIGSPAIAEIAKTYEESKDWPMVSSMQEALHSLVQPAGV